MPQQPSTQAPTSQQPAGQQPSAQQPAGQQPAGQQPAGQQPPGQQPSATKPPAAQPPPEPKKPTQAGPGADTTRFFPGFTSEKITASGATINCVKGGSGPPLLLLHGAPYTHVSWRLVAPELAKSYTVVAADLRGYGDSSKAPDSADHSGYSKRNMALDQVEVMLYYGFDKFAVVGHDRGGRVAHRLALDHADRVTHIALLDIVPTYYSYTHVTLGFVQAYFHWFNYLRAAPGPENELMMQSRGGTTDVAREYQRTQGTAENIHAMCEDYRAAASIDLEHDAADLDQKIKAPLHAMWAKSGQIGGIFDVMAIWKERAQTVTGKALSGGHNLQEDSPDEVLAELTAFLKT